MAELYTCEQVAKRYKVKTITVWKWIRNQELPALKVGKSYRIRESDLEAFEKNCEGS